MENKKVSFYSYSKVKENEVLTGTIVDKFQDPDDVSSPIYKIKADSGEFEFFYRSKKELIEIAKESKQ